MMLARVIAVVILVVAAGRALEERVWAQLQPTFEAASVKENRSGGVTRYSPGLTPDPSSGRVAPPPGQISITNAPLRQLVALAFGVSPNLAPWVMTGGSERMLNTRFDIVAKPPDDAPSSQVVMMLQTLLSERFRLRTHREMRQVPAYAVTRRAVDKLGPRLRPSTDDCTSPSMPTHAGEREKLGPKGPDGKPLCPGLMYEFGTPPAREMTIRYVSPIGFLIDRLQAFVDRPIFDATGLSGSFVWAISFSPGTGAPLLTEPAGLSVYTALEEQLGLELEPRSQSRDVLVIDSVEMPTPD